MTTSVPSDDSPRAFGLSKSRLAAFEQCPKRLWLAVHRPDVAVVDAGAMIRFGVGHEAGAIACSFYPNGVMIGAEPDLGAALESTRALIAAGEVDVIFEATFAHDGILVRVDVLEADGDGGWRVAEVKSSTGVKDYHLGDLATQLWVMSECGIRVSAAVIRHINNGFVLKRLNDYAGLFKDAELGDELDAAIAGRPELVAAARLTLVGAEPAHPRGDHCSRPFHCEFNSYCTRDAPPPPEWPVSLLPHTGKKAAALWAARGISDLRDVPDGALANEVHNRILRATSSGIPYHDHLGAADATGAWAYPRAYLDFETINFAIPRWLVTRPYQQVPFQFSCHVEDEFGRVLHHEYLSVDGRDPRRACAEDLVACCGDTGAVIAYNASFERGCIEGLATLFADLAPALRNIAARLVDLLPVTRAHYYHRDQRGSWSIKNVLPTVAAELDYSALDISEGGSAQAAYLEAIDPATCASRRETLQVALRAYCARDTEAMIVLLRHLTGLPVLEPQAKKQS